MRLFDRKHSTALGSLDQGAENVMQPRRKVGLSLMQVVTPCGEGRGTKREVNIILKDRSNTDYALSRSNLGYNLVRNPAHYNPWVRTTFPAGSPAGYLGK